MCRLGCSRGVGFDVPVLPAVRLSADEMRDFVSVLELLREKVGGGAWTLSVGSESRGFLDYSRDLEINGRKVVADE